MSQHHWHRGYTLIDTSEIDFLGCSAADMVRLSPLDGAAGESKAYMIRVPTFHDKATIIITVCNGLLFIVVGSMVCEWVDCGPDGTGATAWLSMAIAFGFLVLWLVLLVVVVILRLADRKKGASFFSWPFLLFVVLHAVELVVVVLPFWKQASIALLRS